MNDEQKTKKQLLEEVRRERERAHLSHGLPHHGSQVMTGSPTLRTNIGVNQFRYGDSL